MKTINDISNTLLNTGNLITKDIHDYFTDNTFNFTESNINLKVEELLDNFFTNITYKHLTNYIGYQLILANINFQTTVIDKLYNLHDIDNQTLEIEEYTQSLFDILLDNPDKLNSLSSNFYPLPIEQEIFNNYKKISVIENIGDIYNNSLHNKFLNLDSVPQNYRDYLYYLNLTIDLDLSNLNLKDSFLYDYKIFNANLKNSDFTNCDISNCVLNSCDFSGCEFINTTFFLTDIRGSNFIYQDLSSCSLNSVNATLIDEIFTQDRLPETHRYDSTLKMIIKNTENIDKKGLAATNAVNAGISGETIQTLNNLSSLNNGTVSSNLQTIIRDQLLNSTSEVNKRERRHSLVRILLFKSNAEDKKIIFDRDNLLMPNVFLKKLVTVLESNKTISVHEYTNDNGFYVPLQDDEYAIINLLYSDISILILRYGTVNGLGIYSVTKISGTQELYINNYGSYDYLIKQHFIDGDTCRLNHLDLFFGGVGEAELPVDSSGLGDPYIFPIYGLPTKLPDLKNIYRMFQGKNMYINSTVSKMKEEKVNKIEKWFKFKTGYEAKKLGFISNGFFFTEHWICCDNHWLYIDLNNYLIKIKENSEHFFKIIKDKNIYSEKKLYAYDEKFIKYTIEFNSEHHGDINITLKFYYNPQVDNGINLSVQKNKRHCIGLLVNNFKPNLMVLDKITKKKDPKLNKRFKRRKNKLIVRELSNKNEMYI